MKKIYFLTLGLLMGVGLMAQDLTVDFEDLTIGDAISSMSWGDAEAVVADDPLAPGNNVLKFTPNNYNAAPVVSFTLPPGKTLADYSVFQFKGHFAAGDVGWKHILVSVTQDLPSGAFARDENASEGEVIGDFNREEGATTEWQTIEIDITNELSDLTGTIYVAFGMNQKGTDNDDDEITTVWYADDITLVYEEVEVETGDLLMDFEDLTIGDAISSISWGEAEAVVADDPLTSGNNVLKFTPNNYNGAPVVSFTLPAGKTLADYSVFKFKGHFAAGDVGWKHIKVTVTQDEPTGPFDHVESEGTVIGDLNRAKGASTEWETVKIDITNELSALEGTIYVAFGMNQAGKDDNEVTTVWYADDIQLITKATAVSITPVVKPTLNVFTSQGSITIGDTAGKQVAVYSITGSKVFGTSAKLNEVTVNVPTGIYIVVVDGVAKKVAVR